VLKNKYRKRVKNRINK